MTDYYEHKLDPVGVRPDWLGDEDIIEPSGGSAGYFREWPRYVAATHSWLWPAKDGYDSIRIPRDHWAVPYLERGQTPPSSKTTASEHPEYSPELVERALKLVGNMARDYYDLPFADAAEARAILSELDKSKEVDPLLVEARELVAGRHPDDEEAGYRARVKAGHEDDHPAIQNALAALRRGMELAKDEAA